MLPKPGSDRIRSDRTGSHRIGSTNLDRINTKIPAKIPGSPAKVSLIVVFLDSCFLFLLKLKWPKDKSIYDVTFIKLSSDIQFVRILLKIARVRTFSRRTPAKVEVTLAGDPGILAGILVLIRSRFVDPIRCDPVRSDPIRSWFWQRPEISNLRASFSEKKETQTRSSSFCF